MTTVNTPSTHPSALSSVTTLALADCAALLRMKAALAKHLHRVWPTRRVALTPPAMAASVLWDDLGLDTAGGLLTVPGERALVLFAPDDCAPQLPLWLAQRPRVRLHADLDKTQQVAYLSWESGQGQPPLALWVKADAVVAELQANERLLGLPTLPVVMVAGQSVALSELMPEQPWLKAVRAGLAAAGVAPAASTQALHAAAEKAQKYSARPWMFMRYELRNQSEHLAVNWAPVQRMHAGNTRQEHFGN